MNLDEAARTDRTTAKLERVGLQVEVCKKDGEPDVITASATTKVWVGAIMKLHIITREEMEDLLDDIKARGMTVAQVIEILENSRK